jgi:uncharacterized protein
LPQLRDMPTEELSPYLRQHADNPVDWYTWGDEAFERARAEDRPVFLSIGYSACHWCHVMAHESFEDPGTAAFLNASFVCIKVDREERPDVDAVYMEAVQSITGSGGWPMSVFLTPDRRPFFGGTYFPPEGRHGNPSFQTVLGALTDVWDNRRGEVDEQADELSAAISSRSMISGSADGPSVIGTLRGEADGTDLLSIAVEELSRRFDPDWGGFGPAPKFPQPALIDLALRASLRRSDRSDTTRDGVGRSALAMATTTLDAMAAGGIHDHLGGGFARYSTDPEWLVPHFEKMLYDQAGLLRCYVHGWQVTAKPEYLRVIEGIIGYVDRDLTTAQGGIYSAEDADSEGIEGKFYVWTPTDVSAAIHRSGTDGTTDSQSVQAAVSQWFGITEEGNFEGTTILRRPVGAPLDGPVAVELGRRKLFEARSARVRPGLDDKVLTEWNAMYASALAEAASATGTKEWHDRAVAIAEFLICHLRRGGDDRWMRSWRQAGGARHLAYCSDYAWLIDCFTRLAELTGEARWTQTAVATADALLALFHDNVDGGFFTTGHDAEALIVRTKDVLDGATPSANAVAAMALTRLGALVGSERYTRAAREIVELIGELLARHPTAFPHTLMTAEMLRRGMSEVVIIGNRPDLLDTVRSRWRPDSVLAWGQPTESPLWQDREGDRAYVCRNYSCQLPATDASQLDAQLASADR